MDGGRRVGGRWRGSLERREGLGGWGGRQGMWRGRWDEEGVRSGVEEVRYGEKGGEEGK